MSCTSRRGRVERAVERRAPDPRGYTTNPRVHGLFETQFVDLMLRFGQPAGVTAWLALGIRP